MLYARKKLKTIVAFGPFNTPSGALCDIFLRQERKNEQGTFAFILLIRMTLLGIAEFPRWQRQWIFWDTSSPVGHC